MEDSFFENLIRKAVKNIPAEFLEKLDNVNIVSQDWPSTYQIEFVRIRGDKGILLGLYEGIPQTKRGHYGVGPVIPDKITIFKNPLLSISHNLKELENYVKKTVIHEIAHHFGMSEENIMEAVSNID